MTAVRVGFGFDIHRLSPNRPLVLGGVTVPYEMGLEGHSDADVLAHAIGDALLGAAGLGDLGDHFPPGDDRWRDADSMGLLEIICSKVRELGGKPGNIDSTVVLEKPALAPYRKRMRERLARACGMDAEMVSVKATTAEKIGVIGAGEGIAAFAVVAVFTKGEG